MKYTEEYIWNAPESIDGERTLSQHAFISKQRGKYYEDKYEGNISLCGNIGIGDQNGKYLSINQINNEPFNQNKVCKKCLKIVNKK